MCGVCFYIFGMFLNYDIPRHDVLASTIETYIYIFFHLIIFYVQRLFLLVDNLLTYGQIFLQCTIQFNVDLPDILYSDFYKDWVYYLQTRVGDIYLGV